jgi:hypothetical protein
MIREVPKNKFPIRIFTIAAWTQDDRLKCMQVIFKLTSMSLIVASLALMISSSCGVMSREFPVDSLPSWHNNTNMHGHQIQSILTIIRNTIAKP